MSADRSSLALVLLAAGQSTRFGSPKLAAMLNGRPVAHHIADTLASLDSAHRIAVVGPDTPDLAAFGFEQVRLDPPGAPMSRSVALGVAAADVFGAENVLITLADMPYVPHSHFDALLAAFDGNRIATESLGTLMPPALFSHRHFAALAALKGDRGAGSLLTGAPSLPLAPCFARDIDRPDDLKN